MKQPTKKRASEIESIGRGGGSSNVLFLIALRALKSIRMKPKSNQSESDAMVCTVFAVAAVETFVYELGEQAFAVRDGNSHGDLLRGLGALVREMEESRFQLFLKVFWIVRYLTGKPPDRGSEIFQDFDLLVRVRNTIIHLKDEERTLWYQDGSTEVEGTPQVILQLESRGLIPRPYTPSWIVAISSREIAEWSCHTSVRMVDALMNMLPASEFKQWMDSLLGVFHNYHPQDSAS